MEVIEQLANQSELLLNVVDKLLLRFPITSL